MRNKRGCLIKLLSCYPLYLPLVSYCKDLVNISCSPNHGYSCPLSLAPRFHIQVAILTWNCTVAHKGHAASVENFTLRGKRFHSGGKLHIAEKIFHRREQVYTAVETFLAFSLSWTTETGHPKNENLGNRKILHVPYGPPSNWYTSHNYHGCMRCQWNTRLSVRTRVREIIEELLTLV